MAKQPFSNYQKKQDKWAKKRAEKIRDYRKEVSRKASIANKRLKRLEEKGVKTPAYEKWKSDGGEYFSVRGKSYNEVQSELARIENYLESATSTLSGAKKVVKNMIDNTGMDVEWTDWKDMKEQTARFFEIANKVEEYLRTVEDRASSLGYQKIWEAINKYVEENKKGLNLASGEVDEITEDIVKSMKEFEKSNYEKSSNDGIDVWGWATLKKE